MEYESEPSDKQRALRDAIVSGIREGCAKDGLAKTRDRVTDMVPGALKTETIRAWIAEQEALEHQAAEEAVQRAAEEEKLYINREAVWIARQSNDIAAHASTIAARAESRAATANWTAIIAALVAAATALAEFGPSWHSVLALLQ